MSISLFGNTDINDGIVNIYDKMNRTQPEVIEYMKKCMDGKVVISDEYHAGIIEKEGILPKEIVVLSDTFGIDSNEVDRIARIQDTEHVVFGSQELYEAFFPRASTIYMVRQHIVMITFNEFPELGYEDWSIDPSEVKKINTKKKYSFDLTLAVYRRKFTKKAE